MIAASGILVIVAFVTLIAGVFRTGLELIWASIAASVLAALFLALGVVQSNKRRIVPATGGAAMAGAATASPWSDATTTAVLDRGAVPAEADEEEEEAAAEPARPPLTAVPAYEEPAARPSRPAARPAGKAPKAAPKPAPRTAPTKRGQKAPAASSRRAPAATPMVVVVPDRDKFHKETCRYAKNPAAISLTKAQAKRQGYEPCATCKP